MFYSIKGTLRNLQITVQRLDGRPVEYCLDNIFMGSPFFDCMVLVYQHVGMFYIKLRCDHQQRDIMNQGGEGGRTLLRDIKSTRRANSMISYYVDMNLLRL